MSERVIRKKADALCRGESVKISGYIVKLREVCDNYMCKFCPMFFQCDLDMGTICAVCDMLTDRHCQLELE